MSNLLRVRPQARQDIIDCFLRIEEDRPSSAYEFLDAVDNAFGLLRENPLMAIDQAVENPRLEGLQKWPMANPFGKYLIFFLPHEGIDVIRVLHGKRDWAQLLEDE